MSSWKYSLVGSILIASLSLSGCGKAPHGTGTKATPATQATAETDAHDGWWCYEHGVPEEVCTRCHAALAADFKAKNDWCKEHDLPDSQCFIHHPEKEAEFA